MGTTLFKLLDKAGVPTCVLLTMFLTGSLAVWADSRFVTQVGAFAEVKAMVVDIRSSQLGKDIREEHNVWCVEPDKEKKDRSWKSLQEYQRDYMRVTHNGEYNVPPCR